MKSASFYCPYDSVFKVVQTVIRRKGYVIVSSNGNEGLIKAHNRKQLFMKPKTLHMKVYKIDPHITGIKLMINNNASVFDRAATESEREEEKLNDSINMHF